MAQIAGRVFHKIKYWEETFLCKFLMQVQGRGLVMRGERAICQTKYFVFTIFSRLEPIFEGDLFS